jgi:DNA-binding response OmpR family regulator
MSTKILVVDDDKNQRKMIQLTLQNKNLDWEFRSAGDGLEALEVLETYKPDFVLVDLALPRMAGTELIRKMKAKPELSRCKIAVLSSISDEAVMAAVRASGVQELWMKPMLPGLLIAKITALLSSS